MKSFVQSIFLLTNAFGSALGMALTPVAKDPDVLWLFVGLAVATFLGGIVIWILFHDLNKKEDALNSLDEDVVGEKSGD